APATRAHTYRRSAIRRGRAAGFTGSIPSHRVPRGLPRGALPGGGVPVSALPRGGVPVGVLPRRGVPLSVLPCGGLPRRGLPGGGGPVVVLPRGGVPRRRIPPRQSVGEACERYQSGGDELRDRGPVDDGGRRARA